MLGAPIAAWNTPMRITILLAALALLAACEQQRFPVTATGHATAIEAWQQKRADGLRAETGWLTLVGLYWLKPGENRFGSGADNALALEHPALPASAGTFLLENGKVTFSAAPGANITHEGEPVESIAMIDDQHPDATLLEAGSLRFYVIERAGEYGVRVRDLESRARTQFAGLEYFPVSLAWRKEAHFSPWPQPRAMRIINILGMVDEMPSPGELVFEHDGAEYRLTALAAPDDEQWFVMIADGTSGHETYGAGRYLYVDPPVDGVVLLDFNKAYNPPCAFTALATCPLPPPSNRLALRITAGEKNYASADAWHPQ